MPPLRNSRQQQIPGFFNTSIVIPVYNAEATLRATLEPENRVKRDAQAFVMGMIYSPRMYMRFLREVPRRS